MSSKLFSLLIVCIVGVMAIGYAFMMQTVISQAAQIEELKWRNVAVKERKSPWIPKEVDWEAVSKSSQLTGLPSVILVNARKMENGGQGYELGYRGKSAAVVNAYEPSQWQYGEAARRYNALLWEWVQREPKRFKEATEYVARKYTGKDEAHVRYYAKILREPLQADSGHTDRRVDRGNNSHSAGKRRD